VEGARPRHRRRQGPRHVVRCLTTTTTNQVGLCQRMSLT
jgi:hypothetical protein